MNAGAPKEEH